MPLGVLWAPFRDPFGRFWVPVVFHCSRLGSLWALLGAPSLSLDSVGLSLGAISGRLLFMRRRGGSRMWDSLGFPSGVPVAAFWVSVVLHWCLLDSLWALLGVSGRPLVAVGPSLGVPLTAFGWLRSPCVLLGTAFGSLGSAWGIFAFSSQRITHRVTSHGSPPGDLFVFNLKYIGCL